MKIRFAVRTLLIAVAVAASGFALWRTLANEQQIADRFRWHNYSTGVAKRIGSSGWRHRGTITHGLGACVVLKHTVIDYEKYDGSGGYELSFQLPPNPVAGDRFTFDPVPTTRAGELHPHKRGFTLLLPGEFTAHHFGQAMGRATKIPKDQKPELTIKSVDDTQVVLHLKLDIPIRDFYDLKIDRDYTVRRVDPGDG